MNLTDYNARDLLWLGDWSPGWIVALAALGLGVLAVSLHDLRGLSTARRAILTGLRAVVYALAVLMLLEPALDLKQVSRVRNHVAVLLDASRSMELGSGSADQTRQQLAHRGLAQLETLAGQTKADHEFHYFTVGESLRTAPGAEAAATLGLQDASDLTKALESVREQFEGRDLAGVVVLSDGIDTGGIGRRVKNAEELDEASLALVRRLGAPINTLAAGTVEGLRDTAVARVLHDDFAFVHNRVSVDAELQVIGVGSRTFDVHLYREGERLQTRQVAVHPHETRYRVSFEFVPKRTGKEVYAVELEPAEDEALLANNSQPFVLKVIRDKIRVLQVVGRPSWDERFMRQLLKRNPNVDLISFFILRTNASLQLVPTEELSLIPFPTDELFNDELGSFDLIIFQNFDYGPYNMRQYLGNIAEFVRKGGGFAMVGGDLSFASGGYARTPIESILPVRLPPGGSPDSLIDAAEFRPKLTEAGQHHPISRLAFDPVANREIWNTLPAMRGTNIVHGAIPGATVLAEHPSLRHGGKPMPMLTVSEMDKGRVMALTVDSTWRWAFTNVGEGGTPREYQVFWNSAIRWLIKDPELKLLRVEVPRDSVPLGDHTRTTVRLFTPDYSPYAGAEGRYRILRKSLASLTDATQGAEEIVAEDAFKTDGAGEAFIDFRPQDVGIYRIEAQARTESGELLDENLMLVVKDVREFRDILPREELLERLAAATGGHHASLASWSSTKLALREPRLTQVHERRVVQLWDSGWLFALILGLLGGEWQLRRRWGRL